MLSVIGTVFWGDNGNPMDILGKVQIMVKSLRYWAKAVGLLPTPQGKKYQTLLLSVKLFMRTTDTSKKSVRCGFCTIS